MRLRYLIALAVLIGVHLYIWWRLAMPLPSPFWQVGTGVVAVFGAWFPLMRRYAWGLPRATARPWQLAGYMWFGFALYLLPAAALGHIAVALGIDERHAAIAGIALSSAIVIGGLLNVARGPVVRRVQVPLRNLSVPKYTIVQLTDVHVGNLIGEDFVERTVRRVNALKPDLIVITGDLIDGHLSDLRRHVEPLRKLRARDGVYAVTGNHEYYWQVDPWLEHIRSLGIRVLRNEHVTIGKAFELAGVDDADANEDVPSAVAGRDPALPLVLLAHHPRTIERAMHAGVDLQLSGHTHGGQMLPLGWLARLFDPQVAGLGRFRDTWLYVSAGTGFWGPPLRIGTNCEIAAVTIVPES